MYSEKCSLIYLPCQSDFFLFVVHKSSSTFPTCPTVTFYFLDSGCPAWWNQETEVGYSWWVWKWVTFPGWLGRGWWFWHGVWCSGVAGKGNLWCREVGRVDFQKMDFWRNRTYVCRRTGSLNETGKQSGCTPIPLHATLVPHPPSTPSAFCHFVLGLLLFSPVET